MISNLKNIIIGGLAVAMAILANGCAMQPSFHQSNKGMYFSEKNNRPYWIPYQTTLLHINDRNILSLKDSGVTFCHENDILWMQNDSKDDLRSFWNNTEQEANLAARNSGTLEAKKVIWRKFGDTLNQMYQNGTAGCSSPLSEQAYSHYMLQQNQQLQNTTYSSESNINTVPQGLNNVTNQINNMSNNLKNQNQQMQQQNQRYWQSQETNSQLKQLNNNLNGLRYGY